jgi:hypothetical protein
MISGEKQLILRVVERYLQTGIAADEQMDVICLPGNKSTFVETIGAYGRSIMLNEFHVGDRTVWGGFSPRSQTVYLSVGIR